MGAKLYGYIRVSSRDQNEERQIIALKACGIPLSQMYIDKQSGKNFNRPQYKKMIRKLQPEDLLIVQSIDRLGRNYEEIIQQWKYLTHTKKVDIRVLDMPLLDTTKSKDLLGTFISDLVLQLLSFMAQREREMIHCRQAQGIAAAKARGVQLGRPPKPLPKEFKTIQQKWKQGQLTAKEAAYQLGMARATFYRKAR